MLYIKTWIEPLRRRLIGGGTKYFVLAVLCLVIVPIGARAQLGLDPCCAIISVGLNSISSLLKSVVAQPLAAIQQIEQQGVTFEQQVVYPVAAINNAHGLITQLQNPLRQMTQCIGAGEQRHLARAAATGAGSALAQPTARHASRAKLCRCLRNRNGSRGRAATAAGRRGCNRCRGTGSAQAGHRA